MTAPASPRNPEDLRRYQQAVADYVEAELTGAPLPVGDWSRRYGTDLEQRLRDYAAARQALATGAGPPAVTEPPRPSGTLADIEFGAGPMPGGMGIVRTGRDRILNRKVAVKQPKPELAAQAQCRLRFYQEAERLAQLEHPNIPPVYQFGRDADGTPFFVMKLVEGCTLTALLDPPPDEKGLHRFVHIFLQVCRATGFAHARDILHRDLKPDNVVVGPGDATYLIDWGIAKELAAEADGDRSGGAPKPRSGTPAYMPPEPVRGGAYSKQSDVFGLGGVLCAILTGKPPYSGNTAEVRAKAHSADLAAAMRRLDARAGECPELVKLARECLSEKLSDRPADGSQVAARVQAYLDGITTKLLQAAANRRWWRRALVAGSVTAVVIGGIAGWGITQADRRELAELHTAIARSKADQTDKLKSQAERFARFSEIMKRTAARPPGWTWTNLHELNELTRSPHEHITDADLRTEVAGALTGIDVRESRIVAAGLKDTFCLAFHPVRPWVVIGQGRSPTHTTSAVRIVDVTTGATVCDLTAPFIAAGVEPTAWPGVRTVAFSPDGQWLAAGMRSGAVQLWDLAASPPAPLPPLQAHPTFVQSVVFAGPGGPLITVGRTEQKKWELKAWDAGRWTLKAATPPRTAPFYIAWLPGSQQLVNTPSDRMEIFDPATFAATAPGIALSGRSVVSRSGRMVASVDAHRVRLAGLPEPGRPREMALPSGELSLASEAGVVFDPADRLMVLADVRHHRLIGWDAVSGRCCFVHPLRDAEGDALPVAISADGRWIAVGAGDKTVILEVRTPEIERTAFLAAEEIVTVARARMSGGGMRMSSRTGDVTADSFLTIWPSDDAAGCASPVRLLLGAQSSFVPGRVAVSPSGGWAVVTSQAQPMRRNVRLGLFDLKAGKRVREIEAETDVTALTLDDRGHVWAAIGNRVVRFDGPSGGRVGEWAGGIDRRLNTAVRYPALDVSEQWAVVGDHDGRVTCLAPDIGAGRPDPVRGDRAVSKTAITALRIAPDTRRVCVGTSDGRVQVLALPDLSPASEHQQAHAAAVNCCVPLGADLWATGGTDATLRFWRIAGDTWVKLFELRATAPVLWMDVSSDSRRLYYHVKGEAAVRVIDMATLRSHFHRARLGF